MHLATTHEGEQVIAKASGRTAESDRREVPTQPHRYPRGYVPRLHPTRIRATPPGYWKLIDRWSPLSVANNAYLMPPAFSPRKWHAPHSHQLKLIGLSSRQVQPQKSIPQTETRKPLPSLAQITALHILALAATHVRIVYRAAPKNGFSQARSTQTGRRPASTLLALGQSRGPSRRLPSLSLFMIQTPVESRKPFSLQPLLVVPCQAMRCSIQPSSVYTALPDLARPRIRFPGLRTTTKNEYSSKDKTNTFARPTPVPCQIVCKRPLLFPSKTN